jgi:hypothetical protein
MAAEENAVQFLNETAITGLQAFVSNPVTENLSYLVYCPAIYNVAEQEFSMDSVIDTWTLAVFRWIYVRAFVVLGELSRYEAPTSSASPLRMTDDWTKVLFTIMHEYDISFH